MRSFILASLAVASVLVGFGCGNVGSDTPAFSLDVPTDEAAATQILESIVEVAADLGFVAYDLSEDPESSEDQAIWVRSETEPQTIYWSDPDDPRCGFRFTSSGATGNAPVRPVATMCVGYQEDSVFAGIGPVCGEGGFTLTSTEEEAYYMVPVGTAERIAYFLATLRLSNPQIYEQGFGPTDFEAGCKIGWF